MRLSTISVVMLLTLNLLGFTCAVSGQTCNSVYNNTTIESTRYNISSDGTEVSDTETGLVWKRCAVGMNWTGVACSGTAQQFKWQEALSYVDSNEVNYRLPSINELSSLIDRSCFSPAVNIAIFPNIPNYLWSSTPEPNFVDTAQAINTIYGNDIPDKKNGSGTYGMMSLILVKK